MNLQAQFFHPTFIPIFQVQIFSPTLHSFWYSTLLKENVYRQLHLISTQYKKVTLKGNTKKQTWFSMQNSHKSHIRVEQNSSPSNLMPLILNLGIVSLYPTSECISDHWLVYLISWKNITSF